MYDKELLRSVYQMYVSNRIGYNDICLECKAYTKNKNKEIVSGPVPMFHIGKNFRNSPIRLLIIGTVAYGWEEYFKLNENNRWVEIFEGDTKKLEKLMDDIEVRYKDLFNEGKVRILNFLNQALSKIYQGVDPAFDSVAITNFVHCNMGEKSTEDKLPQKVRDFCAHENCNAFVHKEIEILQPTHIIGLSTSWKYDRYLYRMKDINNYNYLGIRHPSARGNSIGSFTNDIYKFLQYDLLD